MIQSTYERPDPDPGEHAAVIISTEPKSVVESTYDYVRPNPDPDPGEHAAVIISTEPKSMVESTYDYVRPDPDPDPGEQAAVAISTEPKSMVESTYDYERPDPDSGEQCPSEDDVEDPAPGEQAAVIITTEPKSVVESTYDYERPDPDSGEQCPSEDDVEDDSIADEDFVPSSTGSDTSDSDSSDAELYVETCEIPSVQRRHSRGITNHTPLVASTYEHLDPDPDEQTAVSGSDSRSQLEGVPTLIPDVVPESEKGRLKKKPRRIPRPCIFCKTMQTNLHRHLLLKHKDEEVVHHAAQLPKPEQRMALTNLKKHGIYEYNKHQIQIKATTYQGERTKVDGTKIILCSACHGFYSKSFISRHKKQCSAESGTAAVSLPVKTLVPIPVTDEFKDCVLTKFRDDEAGNICSSDFAIIRFGNKQYETSKGRPDKQMEVRKTVMAEMRQLATLFLEFQRQCKTDDVQVPKASSEMLQRTSYPQLESAIKTYTLSGTQALKAGLKSSLNFLIRRFGKVCKGIHLVNDSDEKAEGIDKFLAVFGLHYHSLFADATYALNRNRQVKLRRPENLPSDEDVNPLMGTGNYSAHRII